MNTKTPVLNERDVMCLCPVCRDQYRHRGFRVVPKRNGYSDICDWCNFRRGYDYYVVGLLSR